MTIQMYQMKRCCLSCNNDNFRQDNVKEILLRSGQSGGVSIALCDRCRRELYGKLRKEFE